MIMTVPVITSYIVYREQICMPFTDHQCNKRQWGMWWHARVAVGIVNSSINHLLVFVPLCVDMYPARYCSICCSKQLATFYIVSIFSILSQAKDAFRRCNVKTGKCHIWIGAILDVVAIVSAIIFVTVLIFLEVR